MVGASASKSVDLKFISQVDSYRKILRHIHSFSQLGAQLKSDGLKNKSASLLVVSLGKTLNGMPPSCVADKRRDHAVSPSWWPNLTKD